MNKRDLETKNMSDKMQPVRRKMDLGCILFGNLEKAGDETASVSRENSVLVSNARLSDPKAALLKALEEDCKENGWRLCAPQ